MTWQNLLHDFRSNQMLTDAPSTAHVLRTGTVYIQYLPIFHIFSPSRPIRFGQVDVFIFPVLKMCYSLRTECWRGAIWSPGVLGLQFLGKIVLSHFLSVFSLKVQQKECSKKDPRTEKTILNVFTKWDILAHQSITPKCHLLHSFITWHYACHLHMLNFVLL